MDRRETATAEIANVRRVLLAGGVLMLAVALSGHAHARDRLPGDVVRVK